MPLVHDMAVTLPALLDTILATCSYYNSTTTAGAPTVMTATGDVIITTGGALVMTTAFGRTIDRIGAPLGTLYSVAMPSVLLNSTLGTTGANNAIVLGCKLQHGDSSSAGDMADYSTGEQPADRQYGSTARTTDMLSWEVSGRSTGAIQLSSNPAYYDLKAAKRYIRVAVRVGLPQTTATTGTTDYERSRLSAAITFLGASYIPQQAADRYSPYSTSTSTI